MQSAWNYTVKTNDSIGLTSTHFHTRLHDRRLNKNAGKDQEVAGCKAKASIIVYEWDLINKFKKYKMGKRCLQSDVDSYFYHSNTRVWIQFRKLHNYAFWNKSHSHNHKYRTLTFAISVSWTKVTKSFLKPWNHYCSVGTLRQQTNICSLQVFFIKTCF